MSFEKDWRLTGWPVPASYMLGGQRRLGWSLFMIWNLWQSFWAELLTKDFGYVAHDQGRVVGFCSREDDNVSGLFILKEARGCGIGKRLLDLAKADRDWITVWAYEANTGARKFYHREGLVEIKRELEEFDDGNSLMDVEHRWTRQT